MTNSIRFAWITFVLIIKRGASKGDLRWWVVGGLSPDNMKRDFCREFSLFLISVSNWGLLSSLQSQSLTPHLLLWSCWRVHWFNKRRDFLEPLTSKFPDSWVECTHKLHRVWLHFVFYKTSLSHFLAFQLLLQLLQIHKPYISCIILT